MSRASEIAAELDSRRLAVCEHLFPAGKKRGDEFEIGNLAGDPGRSLKVHLNGKGTVWSDFASGETGGDLLDLWAAARCDGTKLMAMREVADWLGLPPPKRRTKGNGRQAKSKLTPAVPKKATTPATAPPPHPELGEPDLVFDYFDAAGEMIMQVCRWDREGGKEIRPRHFDGKRWQWKDPPGALPLYNLPDLVARPEAPVVMVEGEKVVDHVTQVLHEDGILSDYVVTTWPHGSSATSKVDLTPLKGKIVVLFPDADDPGLKAMREMGANLIEAGAFEVKITKALDELGKGADLADCKTPEHVDLALKRIKEAPITHHPPVIDVLDFMKLDLPPREMVIDPLLPRKGIMLITAPAGAGKTYLAFSLAHAVAIGGKLLKWSAPKPRRVLYIDGEMDGAEFQERIAATTSIIPPVRGFLQLWTPDHAGRTPDLSTPEGQAMIEPWLAGVEVVFLDSISTLCRTGVENVAEDWAPVQAWLLDLKRRGISSVLVHHTGWAKEHGRGTSKRLDVINTELLLKPSEDHGEGETRFEIHLTKKRGITGRASTPIEAQFCIRNGTVFWTYSELREAQAERAVKLSAQGMTQRDISDEIGVGLGTVNRWLQKAAKDV